MERMVATSPKRETMASRNDIVILCIADSVTRLTYIARTVKKFGYAVHIGHSDDHAVAVAATSTNSIGAIVMDEDLLLNGFSVSESLKMVSAAPILLISDKGLEGQPKPAGIDLVPRTVRAKQLGRHWRSCWQSRWERSRPNSWNPKSGKNQLLVRRAFSDSRVNHLETSVCKMW